MNKKINFGWYGIFLFLFVIISIVIMTILYLYVQNKIFFAIFIFIFIYLINSLLSLWMINSKKRTNYSKMTWILAFCLLPIIGLFLYLLWGRNPYKDHSKNSYLQENKIFLSLIDYSETTYFLNTNNLQTQNFMYLFKYNYNLYLEPIYLNNSILPIFENEKFLEIVLNYIKKAQKIIFIQEYIISSGFYLNIIMDELIKKADEGVKIFILYDRVGSFKKFNKKDFLKLIQHSNIQIMEFESDKDFKFTSTTNYRNHRKMFLIDNKFLISGGSNIGEEYINQKYNFVNWKDFNFILSGPIIQRYFISFTRDWINNSRYPFIFYLRDYLNTKSWRKFIAKFLFIFWSLPSKKQFYKAINFNRKKYDIFEKYKENFNSKSIDNNFEMNDNFNGIIPNCYMVFSNTGPRFFNNSLTEQIIASIITAKKNIKIITPYFYINESIINALNTASRLGVKIDIILPKQKDKWFLLIMNRSNYEKILNFENITIYEYDGFIHTKAMIIDDDLLLLGSYNLDLRSLSSNFENILIVYSKKLIEKMNEYFSCLLIHTNCINYLNKDKLNKHFFERFISFLLKIIHPLL